MSDATDISELSKAAIKSARAAFGHVEGRTDLECLVLCVSQQERLGKEDQRLLDWVREENRNLVAMLPPHAKYAGLPLADRAGKAPTSANTHHAAQVLDFK